MISRIEGELCSILRGVAELRCGRVWYQLLVPACDEQRLATLIGQSLEVHTLHYLESQGQGASYIPRLIGFRNPQDRAFFELFTTVKGIGHRKALRALQLPFRDVAAAIAARDTDLLRTLPEIGKRTAETIVAELNGKVDRFVEVKPAPAEPQDPGLAHLIADAVAVMAQLGENRRFARQLVERAAQADPTLQTADALVTAALRLKERD
jgi:Holliday junction DNA helicase RuvA